MQYKTKDIVKNVRFISIFLDLTLSRIFGTLSKGEGGF